MSLEAFKYSASAYWPGSDWIIQSFIHHSFHTRRRDALPSYQSVRHAYAYTWPHTHLHTLILREEQTGRAERLRLCYPGWVIIAHCASREAAWGERWEGAGWVERRRKSKRGSQEWQRRGEKQRHRKEQRKWWRREKERRRGGRTRRSIKTETWVGQGKEVVWVTL